MHNEYIEQRHAGYYIARTRISLDSVVYSFNQGKSLDALQEDFPLLRRAQEREFEGRAIPLAEENPALWERLQRVKAQMGEFRA